MTLTITWASVFYVAGGLAAIWAAWKAFMEARKLMNKPQDEIKDKLKHHDDCLARDKKRLDEIEDMLIVLGKDNEIELKALRDIMNHLRTDNHTGEIEQLEDDINEYLITRVKYVRS